MEEYKRLAPLIAKAKRTGKLEDWQAAFPDLQIRDKPLDEIAENDED